MLQRLVSVWRGATAPGKPLLLGRWCHPSSEIYKATCNQEVKAMWNIHDHGHVDAPFKAKRPVAERIERDPVSVFVCGYGI